MSKPTVVDAETGEIIEQEPQTQALAAVEHNPVANITPEALEKHLAEFEAKQRIFDGFIQRSLKEGVDYGAIPGSRNENKKELWQPGAEKICKLIGQLAGQMHPVEPHYEFIDRTVDTEQNFVMYSVRCELKLRGQTLTESIGAANSREKGLSFGDAVGNQHNIQARACKRAYVSAARKLAGLSDRFTDSVDAVQTDDSHSQAAAPRQERKSATKPSGSPITGTAWLDEPLAFGKQHATKTWRQMVLDKTPNSKGEIEFAGPSYLKWMSEKVNDPAVKAKAKAAFEMYLNMDLEKPAEPAAAPEPAQPEAQIDKAADKAALRKRAENRVLYMEQELSRRGIKKFSDLSKQDQDSLNAEIESWLDADQDDIPF